MELKNKIVEFKNSIKKFNRRLEEVEERISELEEKSFYIIMFEEQKRKRMKKK